MTNWLNLSRVTAPSVPLISLEKAKAHLRVSHDDEDELIADLVETATAFIEGGNGIGIALLTQTWRTSLTEFPSVITIPLGPVQSIESITYRDPDGEVTTVAPASYLTDLDTSPTYVTPLPGASWPSGQASLGSVKIEFVAGYGDAPEDVPADLRHAALMLIAHLYQNTDAASSDGLVDVPFGVDAILNRYRVSGIA